MRRADIKPLPAQAELLRLFAYAPEHGALIWRTRPAPQAVRIVIGTEAGTVNARGYRAVGLRIGGKLIYYLAHRLIWKMMTGAEPCDQIDHIDGNRVNNRWANLRQADNGQNLQNSKLRVDNRSGFKGVTRDASRKSTKNWRAIITTNGKIVRLGWFATPEEAHAARTQAAKRLHGGYARLF